MCLSYAVSLLAHNIKIESLKDETKVKQIKECMSIILDPLLEQPDAYQIAYIKKVLNKIKSSDDGHLALVVQSQMSSSANNNSDMSSSGSARDKAIQSLCLMNSSLCFICEIFLFHLHSKSSNYLAPKDYQFDVKLPSGFFAPREHGTESDRHQERIDKEIREGLKGGFETKHDEIEDRLVLFRNSS